MSYSWHYASPISIHVHNERFIRLTTLDFSRAMVEIEGVYDSLIVLQSRAAINGQRIEIYHPLFAHCPYK